MIGHQNRTYYVSLWIILLH